MDVTELITVFEATVRFFNSTFNTALPESWAPFMAVPIALPFVLFGAYAATRQMRIQIRRWRGNRNELDPDGHAVVGHIREDLEKLQSRINRAVNETDNKELLPLLKILTERLHNAEGLVSANNDDPEETKLDRHGRVPRRHMVRLVREIVLSNLWAGNYFDETIKRRHVYRATCEGKKRKMILVEVRTPFANDLWREDELPYAIDIREGTTRDRSRYVLRIQWDPVDHDDLVIKHCKRGEWEDVILSWNVTQQYIPKVADQSDVAVNTEAKSSAAM